MKNSMKNSMKNFAEGSLDFVEDSLDEATSRIRKDRDAGLDDANRTGFEEAAEICLGLLAKNIDDLQSKLGNLSKDEQIVLSRLLELETATRKNLGAPWSRRT
jgi:hypothetical protein